MVPLLIPLMMSKIDKIVEKMTQEPSNISFLDLVKVCEYYFGKPRQSGSSHMIFKMPWQGDPRINIQNHNGKAKPYQVRQLLIAIKKLRGLKHGH